MKVLIKKDLECARMSSSSPFFPEQVTLPKGTIVNVTQTTAICPEEDRVHYNITFTAYVTGDVDKNGDTATYGARIADIDIQTYFGSVGTTEEILFGNKNNTTEI